MLSAIERYILYWRYINVVNNNNNNYNNNNNNNNDNNNNNNTVGFGFLV